MQKTDFHYELPPELIAQHPSKERSASRLMVVDGGEVRHCSFKDFPSLIEPGDLLVFNDTKVIPARLYGTKQSGGKIEILVERILDEHHCLAHIKASKAPKADSQLNINEQKITVVSREDNLFKLYCESSMTQLLSRYGHMPLPPYITRSDETADQERYQTVYAKKQGAVAAPTAGLHFDAAMLDSLKKQGIQTAFVTLHVGAGTFMPVRTENIEDHKMHAEYIDVSDDVCEKVNATKRAGKRVVAIGTTSVRCLETAAKSGMLKPYVGDTDIFIYPGYQFQIVDALLTNFHLPESTLLMLVSAFSGSDVIKKAYRAAIEERYRFFSYGDAMFLTRGQS